MEISLSWWRGGRRSYSSPGMVQANLKMRRVGSFIRGLDSSASSSQRLYEDSSQWTWACAVNPLSVSLFMTRARCSITICVALSRIGERPRPVSFRGLCTFSVGKLGRRPRVCLIALLRMASFAVGCLSLNTPRCVTWYFDFSDCSMACDLRKGLRLRFARAFASFLTSLVICRKCSRKSSVGSMWTPIILYDLFGGRYLMCVPSANVVELICSCSMV